MFSNDAKVVLVKIVSVFLRKWKKKTTFQLNCIAMPHKLQHIIQVIFIIIIIIINFFQQFVYMTLTYLTESVIFLLWKRQNVNRIIPRLS